MVILSKINDEADKRSQLTDADLSLNFPVDHFRHDNCLSAAPSAAELEQIVEMSEFYLPIVNGRPGAEEERLKLKIITPFVL